MESLHENAPAYGEDSDYLAELERVRRALLGRMTRCDLLAAEAQVRATVAVAAMAAAMARRPPDYAAYSAAQARHQDAVTAIDICNDVASRFDGQPDDGRQDRDLEQVPGARP
jgi:hypothetical protein